MRKVILVMLISIVSLSLIGCSNPEEQVKNVTNDYYQALVNKDYEKAFETLYLYDFTEENHPTDGTTLSQKEAKEFYMKKVNVLKENNYKVKDFEITKVRKEDGHTSFAEVKFNVEVNGESFEWRETVDEWEGKAWIINENDPFSIYRDGKMNLDIEVSIINSGNDPEELGEVALSEEEAIDFAENFFEAQNDKDYDYLESVIAQEVELERSNDKFIFENSNGIVEQSFSNINLNNLEFRFIQENQDIVTVGFAEVSDELNIELYLDLKNVDGNWKLTSFITN
ncbi:outer membrane protein assembly factor BamD [Oceanobacillus damuensis]|uniref:hypothetical protein n=1 Tax=Oceanobacillus damuensis TaxID=937928 RepID=UPI000B1BA7A0|nr:hypothetical protein [Oceanobacillus damuensis]